MEEVPNVRNIGPTNTIQILNQREFFEDFVRALQMIF